MGRLRKLKLYLSTLAVLTLAVVLWTLLPPKTASARPLFGCGHSCGSDVGAACGDPGG
jgi:hypothetical protein